MPRFLGGSKLTLGRGEASCSYARCRRRPANSKCVTACMAFRIAPCLYQRHSALYDYWTPADRLRLPEKLLSASSRKPTGKMTMRQRLDNPRKRGIHARLSTQFGERR